jgi:hypothetical protein
MKATSHSRPIIAAPAAQDSAAARYQIYQQTRSGVFTPGFKSDSAGEIVEAFLRQAPVFEGGELRIWNHRAQEMSAAVVWRTEKSDFGFPVHHRTNLFHDRLLGVVARQLQEREAIRADVRQEAGMTVAV